MVNLYFVLVLKVEQVVGCSIRAIACVSAAICADVRRSTGRQGQRGTMRPGRHVLRQVLAGVLDL